MAVTRCSRDFGIAWEPGDDYRAIPEKIFEGSADTVVVFAQESGRGKDSGIELRSRLITGVYGLREGKIVRFKAYLDRAEALKAVGLRD